MPESADSVTQVFAACTEFKSVCVETEAPCSLSERSQLTTGRADHLEGLSPRERPMLPGYDSTIVLLLLGLFIFVTANFKHYSTYLKSLSQELLNVRRRPNVFNDHTVSETRVLVSLILIVCFSEAILLFSTFYTSGSGLKAFPLMLLMIGLTLLYYVVQLAAYSTVGNVFTDRENAAQWIKGFNASQSLLGIVLIVPALLTLFYPATSAAMLTIGIIMYIVARIVFICKGFKIFYHNLFSLVYFILYLCALEIAPLVAAYRGSYLITLL